MNLPGHPPKMRNDGIIVEADSPRPTRRARVHARRPKRLDEPGAAFRLLHVIPNVAVGRITALAEMRIVRRADNSIFRLRGPDANRRKQQTELRSHGFLRGHDLPAAMRLLLLVDRPLKRVRAIRARRDGPPIRAVRPVRPRPNRPSLRPCAAIRARRDRGARSV